MNIIRSIFVVLLMVSSSASAQKTYYVGVSNHSTLPAPSEEQVNQILAAASKMLQKEPDHVDADEDVVCNVTFTLKGPIHNFPSPHAEVFNQDDINALHRIDSGLDVDFHIRIAERILFCRETPGEFSGCAYPPQYRTILLLHPNSQGQVSATYPTHVLWAHEFGHLTGLGHRKDSHALMKCGGVTRDSVRVKREECRCMLSGLESCPLPPTLFC